MIKYIEEQINSFKDEEDEENIKILKILAEDKKNDNGVIKAFGISNLMKITSESVKKGIESSCIESLIEKGVKILKDEFEENINDLKKSIFNELNLSDLDVKEGFDIINEILIKDEDPVTINQNFDFQNFTKFILQFSKKLAESLIHKDKLNQQSLVDLLNIMKIKCNDIKNNFEEIFEKKINDISIQLADKIDTLVHNIDSSYDINYLCSKYSHNQLKLQARNNMINDLKPDIEDQIYKEISKKLYDIYAENFSNRMIEIFNDFLNGENTNKKIEDIFFDKGHEVAEKIHNKINKLLDYPNDDYVENKKKKKGKSVMERMNQRKKPKDNKNETNEEEEEEEEDE